MLEKLKKVFHQRNVNISNKQLKIHCKWSLYLLETEIWQEPSRILKIQMNKKKGYGKAYIRLQPIEEKLVSWRKEPPENPELLTASSR